MTGNSAVWEKEVRGTDKTPKPNKRNRGNLKSHSCNGCGTGIYADQVPFCNTCLARNLNPKRPRNDF